MGAEGRGRGIEETGAGERARERERGREGESACGSHIEQEREVYEREGGCV